MIYILFLLLVGDVSFQSPIIHFCTLLGTLSIVQTSFV